MIQHDKALAWIHQHRISCNAGIRTGAWFGLQWDSCKDWVNVQCNGCKEFYIEERQAVSTVGSSGASAKSQTKNFEKEETDETRISTRKIRNWKIRNS